MSDDPCNSLVSVIIVNYNGIKFLEDCFRSLYHQTCSPCEVILVDNASRDGSIEFIQEHFPDVKILIQTMNLGFAGGTNAGIREAQGEFILTLNNDTIVTPCFIEELIKPMTHDPSVGMCASKMVFPDARVNSTGLCISRSGAAWNRGMFESDQGQFDQSKEVFGPCAGAALYRRAMLDEIGLFDEDFFMYMEDVDLAFRARLSGWKCIYVPTAQIIHKHGGTAGFKSDLSIYYGNRNLVWYVVKNFPSRTLFLSSPWVLGRNCAALLYYILHGRGRTIIRAKTAMIQGLPAMVRKRRDIKRRVPTGETEKWILTWSRVSKP